MARHDHHRTSQRDGENPLNEIVRLPVSMSPTGDTYVVTCVSPDEPEPLGYLDIWRFEAQHVDPMGRLIRKSFPQFVEFNLGRPTVLRTRVSEPYRHQGIATRMYAEAFLWMVEFDLRVWADSVQQRDGIALWAFFDRQGWVGREDGRRYLKEKPQCR